MTGRQAGVTWIVVANQQLARIYARARKFGDLVEVKRLENAAGQKSARDLVSDRPGRAFESAGPGRHAMEPPTDPKDQEADRFAREIAREVEAGRTHDQFGGIVLVAGPAFLGRLRHTLSDAARKMVEREVDKNFQHFDAAEIRSFLDDLEP